VFKQLYFVWDCFVYILPSIYGIKERLDGEI